MPLNSVQSPPPGGAKIHSKHLIHIFVSTNPFHRTTACKKGHYKGKKSRNQMIENIWLNHESRRLQRNHVAQFSQSSQLDQQFTPAIIQNIFSLFDDCKCPSQNLQIFQLGLFIHHRNWIPNESFQNIFDHFHILLSKRYRLTA